MLAIAAPTGAAGAVATADPLFSMSAPRARHCPMCEGTDIEDDSARWRCDDPDRDFPMSRCATCATVFVDPVPSAGVIEAAYPDDFYGRRRSDTERIEEWFLSRRLRLCGPLVGRSVLDVGSGDGKFLKRALAAGAARVSGVEPSVNGRRLATGASIRTVGDVADLDADDRYDVVTLWQVFEHVPDPRRLGRAVVDRLVPGGRLVLSVPNVESYEAERFGADWFHLDVPRHLVFPPSRTLRSVFEELGVRHVETVDFSAEYGPYGLMQSVLNHLGSRHNALYHRLKRKQPLAAHDSRGKAEVILGLAALPVLGPASIVGAATLARRGRAGTYTAIFERPAA
jgi:SAM-dependent methyltransferase